jgi:hypothetical protein
MIESLSVQAIIRKTGGSKTTQGVCKLCGRWAELRRSHVLPDMAYADVIDPASHPRTVVVRDVDKGRTLDKSRQTGFWERLLCQKCEGRFSKYETYAANHLLNAKLPAPDLANPVITVRVDDYRKLKLFLLSLLWRVGVARGPFFRCVDLGPHESRLRGMLDAEDPGEPDEYGCLITPLLPEPDAPMERVITMPAMTRVDGHNGCLLVFRGFVFQYFISRHGLARGVKQAFLDKQGQALMIWAHGTQFPPLREL